MTEIDAINKMLRYLGELPIPNSISLGDLPEGHEALIAKQILEETSRELQEDRWWFNSTSMTFTPDTNGYIMMPPNFIGMYANDKYILYGNDLYDKTQQTKLFTSPVTLDVLLELSFSDIPYIVKTLIVLRASKQLHTSLNGDETTKQDLEKSIIEQSIKVNRENTRQLKTNLIRGNRLIDRGSNPSILV